MNEDDSFLFSFLLFVLLLSKKRRACVLSLSLFLPVSILFPPQSFNWSICFTKIKKGEVGVRLAINGLSGAGTVFFLKTVAEKEKKTNKNSLPLSLFLPLPFPLSSTQRGK